jgi:hypothetical protein
LNIFLILYQTDLTISLTLRNRLSRASGPPKLSLNSYRSARKPPKKTLVDLS